MAQPHPTLINLPPPSSRPDTPSEIPGTPTSTTTSLSALSTTAIKDGHRGHALPNTVHRPGGHQQHASQNSLEAERADRISRLAGLSSVSQLRTPASVDSAPPANASNSPQITPTSAGFPQNVNRPVAPQVLGVPAYFDSNGQPVAVTKMSTVGTASATESVSDACTRSNMATWDAYLAGDKERRADDETSKQDIDMMSTDTNFGRETEADSASGYVGNAPTEHTADMEVDEDNMTNRSVGQFEQEDNMSDDGSASLVGFGEGANSTISGPIYVRRPLPGTIERTSSGLSEGATLGARRERLDREDPIGDRRDPRVFDAVSPDGVRSSSVAADDGALTDTNSTTPAPVSGSIQPGSTSALRETQHGANTRHHLNHQQPPTAREAAERAMREKGLDPGQRSGASPTASPGKRLAFEDQK